MNHTRTIRLPGVKVWSECSNSPGERFYVQAQQPATLPVITSNPSDSQPKLGISTIAFNNPDGTLIATRNDSMPTTVWIWSLKLLRPYAVLVQLNPIRSISWHPTVPDLLMIQCSSNDVNSSVESPKGQGVIYLWSVAWAQPRALTVPMERLAGSTWARWILTAPPSKPAEVFTATASSPVERRSRSFDSVDDRKPIVMFGDRDGFVVGHVEDEPVLEGEKNGEVAAEKDAVAAEDRVGLEFQQIRPWDPVDWDYFAQTEKFPKRSLSSGSQVPPYSNPGNSKSLRGGLGSVTSSTSATSGRSSPNAKEPEDAFEYRTRGHNVRANSQERLSEKGNFGNGIVSCIF